MTRATTGALLFAAAGLILAMEATAAEPPERRDPLREIGVESAAGGNRDVRVQITAHTSTTVGASMTGRLANFPLRDGDRFKEGQVLARFDCGVAEGAVARARATHEKKKKVLETGEKLRQLGSNSALELEIAAAEVREAAAESSAAQVIAARCLITAPFAGRVGAIMTREFQHVSEGAPLLEILDDRNLELELIVPSRWLAWLKPGVRFVIAVDETGRTYKAEIFRLSGKVDAVSQSIKVYGRLIEPAPDLLPGMSGKALLTPP